MQNQREYTGVNLNESSVYAEDKTAPGSNLSDNFATDGALDRLEAITGGAEEPLIAEGELGQKFDELEASTEEELDALQVNLLQEDERPNARDGSGLIVDEAAEERIARFTESDPTEHDSERKRRARPRRHQRSAAPASTPDSTIARSDAVVEGNIDEPIDETKTESRADEGTAG